VRPQLLQAHQLVDRARLRRRARRRRILPGAPPRRAQFCGAQFGAQFV
jgi:hypothetical protein